MPKVKTSVVKESTSVVKESGGTVLIYPELKKY